MQSNLREMPSLADGAPKLGTDETSGTRPKRRASTVALNYGRLDVKIYPVTKEKLDNLSRLDLLAGAFLSAATGSLGFAVGLTKDLMLASEANVVARAFWTGVDAVMFVVCIICFMFSAKFWIDRGTKRRSIETETVFEQ